MVEFIEEQKTISFDSWILVDFCYKEEKLHDICLHSNLPDERTGAVFLAEFLETQRGLPVDGRDIIEKDIYEIDIGVQVSDNTFGWVHNCGNRGKATGMLIALLAILTKRQRNTNTILKPGGGL